MQRQYRPGDVLDDYCPRERRITDHAVVAMVDGEVQRTRCVVCEAEHEFKNARVPTPRRKPAADSLFTQVLDALDSPTARLGPPGAEPDRLDEDDASSESTGVAAAATPPPSPSDDVPADLADDRPFRRSLIRAQLPRPEGQPPPARAIPEFTMHQPLNQRGKRPGHGRFRRRQGGGVDNNGPMRFGREGHGGSGQGGRRRRRKKH